MNQSARVLTRYRWLLLISLLITVIAVLAYSYNTFVREKRQVISQAQYEIAFDYDTNQVTRLKKLLSGKIDVAVISPGQEGLLATIADDPYLKKNVGVFVIISKSLAEDPLHVACSKTMNKKALLQRIDEGFLKLKYTVPKANHP